MTYSNLVEYLKAKALIVNQSGTFIHGKKPDASLISSSTIFPLIWLAPFRETTDRVKGNVIRQVTVAFFTQDSTNITLEDRQALIESMWSLKEAFMSSINNDIPRTISAIGESATPEYSQLSGKVSGYAINFTVQSKLPC